MAYNQTTQNTTSTCLVPDTGYCAVLATETIITHNYFDFFAYSLAIILPIAIISLFIRKRR